jgi:hypothetical protein
VRHFCFLILWLIIVVLNFLPEVILERFGQFCPCIFDTLVTEGKSEEDKGEDGVEEKPLLSLLAVFVHGVPNDREFNLGIHNQLFDLVLLKMVAQNHRQHGRGKYILSQIFLVGQNLIQICEIEQFFDESIRLLKEILLFLDISGLVRIF